MSKIKEAVDRHMVETRPPSMTVVSASVEEEQGTKEKSSGVLPAFPEEPQEEPVAAEPEEAASEEPTNEDVDDAVGGIMDRLGFGSKIEAEAAEPEPPSEEEPSEGEPSGEEAPTDEETPAEEEAKAKEKKPRTRRKKKDWLNADDIRGIIRETAQSAAKPAEAEALGEEAKPEDPVDVLNKADLEAFAEMEKNPKYEGLKGKYKAYLVKLSQYKKNWETENPTSTFNMEDMEHEDFTSSSQPEYDPSDFQDAKITVKAREIVHEQDKAYRTEIDELKSSIDESGMKDELHSGANDSYAEIVKLADESYLKVVQEGGGEALQEADPIAHQVLNEVLAANDKHLYELEKLAHPSNKFRLNMSNETHRELIDFAVKKEQDISSLPVSQQMHEGKRFATTKEFMDMGEEQRKNHWNLQPKHIKAMYVTDLGQQAKTRIEKQREMFDKYTNYKSGKKTAPKEKAKAEKPQQKRAQSNPPSTTGEALASTGGTTSANVNLGDDSYLKGKLWG